MDVTQYLNAQYFGEQQNEQDIMNEVRDDVTSCDYFIDLGASFGVYSKFALENNDNLHLVSIEPDKFRFAELQKNVESWRKNNAVELFQNVVYDRAIELDFYTDETQKSGLIGGAEKHAHSYKVTSVQLDELVTVTHKKIVIKIDIEGSELGAILGAQNLIANNDVTIVLEVHTWGDLLLNRGKPSEVLAQLKANGFGAKKINGRYILRQSRKGQWLLKYNVMKEYLKEQIRRK